MNNQVPINLEPFFPEADKKQPDLLKEKENSQNIEEIYTRRNIKGLAQFNKNLAQVAQKFAHQNELNGLLLIGTVANNFTQAIDPFLEKQNNQNQLDKQGAGVAVIRRLSEIFPDRFTGNPQPFTWKDPELRGKIYQFQLKGGLISEKGITKFIPRILTAIDLSTKSEVFKAISSDNRSWKIEKCDFTCSQLMGLSKAHNIVQKNEQKQEKSHVRQGIQLEK